MSCGDDSTKKALVIVGLLGAAFLCGRCASTPSAGQNEMVFRVPTPEQGQDAMIRITDRGLEFRPERWQSWSMVFDPRATPRRPNLALGRYQAIAEAVGPQYLAVQIGSYMGNRCFLVLDRDRVVWSVQTNGNTLSDISYVVQWHDDAASIPPAIDFTTATADR